MKLSKKVESLPPYLFVQISRKIAAKKAKREEVISFGIGDPDIPTPEHIINELCRSARDPANHRYPESEGLLEFRRGVAQWYQTRFGVILDPEKEVVSLIEKGFYVALSLLIKVISVDSDLVIGLCFGTLSVEGSLLPSFDRN
jgi:aspartate/methionine/tyrosine aminotransferase